MNRGIQNNKSIVIITDMKGEKILWNIIKCNAVTYFQSVREYFPDRIHILIIFELLFHSGIKMNKIFNILVAITLAYNLDVATSKVALYQFGSGRSG